jgi:ubiquinone/menaquinone biosynthesis C-methylase UbiE
MSNSSYQQYLLTHQYKNAHNFNARVQLHARFSTNKYGWHRWVFDHFNIPSPARLLELGCGPAGLWTRNLKRIPAGWEIILSDFSPGMLEQAQQNLRNSPQPFSFQQLDAQSIPFEDHQFDAVIANHMLYHVPDKAKALTEIRRVLKPGGRFYAATNGQDYMPELKELLQRFDPEIASLWNNTSSSSFNLENGREILSQAFSTITLHLYEDSLVVTEAAPLVAYVLSMPISRLLTGEKLTQFNCFVEQELASYRAIHITKATGLFEAF